MTKTIGFLVWIVLFSFVGFKTSAQTESVWVTQASIEISKSPQLVWKVVKDYKNLSWISPKLSVSSSSANSIGDLRVIEAPNGFSVSEKLTKYDSTKFAYRYSVTKIKNSQTGFEENINDEVFSSELSVTKIAKGTRVIWKAQIYRSWLNSRSDQVQVTDFVEHFYHESLASLKLHVDKL